MKLIYPVAKADGTDYTASELLSALSLESGGYYLLSRHQFWHGGVHMTTEQFPQHRSDIPLRAIADGEVVAWRVNDAPEFVPYYPKANGPYQYSTGFCLIRHTFVSPKQGPTAEERMQYWAGREIELLQERPARNVKSEEFQKDEDYTLSLPAGARVRVVSVERVPQNNQHQAQIVTQEAYRATNRAGRAIEIPAWQRLWLPLFDQDGQPLTHGRNKSPVFQEVDHGWRDTRIVLNEATTVHCYPASGTSQEDLRILPVGTKVQIYDHTEGEPTLAMLLHDVPARDADNRSVFCPKESLVRIDCFDTDGKLRQRNGKPLFEKTPTARQEQYTFEFYSLYMHLCNYQDYPGRPTAADLTPTVTVERSDVWARDQYEKESSSQVLGQLSPGAKLRIVERIAVGNALHVRAVLQEGAVKHGEEVTATEGDTVWVLAQEGNAKYIPLPEEQQRPEIIWPAYWQGKVTARPRSSQGLEIWEECTDNGLVRKIGILSGTPENTFTYEMTRVRTASVNGKTRQVARCTPTGTMTFAGQRQRHGEVARFWTIVDDTHVIKDDLKPICNKVHTGPPMAIEAGDPVGYLGIYQAPRSAYMMINRHQMHFEIFTPDRALVDYLLHNPLGQSGGKQYLRLPKGAIITIPTEGRPESYRLRYEHAIALDQVKTEDRDGKTWYEVEVEGKTGCIEKTEALEIINQHEWAKLGFQIVKEDDPDHDGFLNPASISGVFLEVYKAIDTDGKNGISPLELKNAQSDPTLREMWSKLIGYHPTEWRYHRPTETRYARILTPGPQATADHRAFNEGLLKQEVQRFRTLRFWEDLDPKLPESLYHFHPVRFVECFYQPDECCCGCCLGKIFVRNRWVRKRRNYPDVTYYGPYYGGTKKLDKFAGWDDLISKSKATEDEKAIVIAMSSNEGAMDAVQAWDWQTFSAGAMQKTVTPEGYGELPQQISEFKADNPALFDELFARCGWSIKQEAGKARIYYASDDTGNKEITGQYLYDFIKQGFQKDDSGFPKESKPLASIVHAIIHEEYQKKQVIDFVRRIRSAIAKKPRNYASPASDFFQTRLGRALVLDHDVNAPGNVSQDLKSAVDTLLSRHPGLSDDPNQWGVSRPRYENELIRIYGPSRRMNSPIERYNHLRSVL